MRVTQVYKSFVNLRKLQDWLPLAQLLCLCRKRDKIHPRDCPGERAAVPAINRAGDTSPMKLEVHK